jgi:hypothetical protein
MAAKATKQPDDPVNLRLRMPEALRLRLTALAKANERSLNSEIVYRLGQSLGPEGQEMVRMHEGFDERVRRILAEAIAEERAKAKKDREGEGGGGSQS